VRIADLLMLKWIQKDVFQESRISLLIFLDLANS